MLPRLVYLAATNTFALLRLLPMSDRDKDIEILMLRHQLTVLERQLGTTRVKFAPEDRAFLAALPVHMPRGQLWRLRLLVHPDTILRWHRDLIRRRHGKLSRPSLPPTERSIRRLVLGLARENTTWGHRHTHGELTTLGIQIAPSTVWEILKTEGIDPAPQRDAGAKARFLIRARDAKFPALIGEILADADVRTILTSIRAPRMNAVMERWVQTLRRELLDRSLIWNEHHLRHALREYEQHYNEHRTQRSLQAAAPLRPPARTGHRTRANHPPRHPPT